MKLSVMKTHSFANIIWLSIIFSRIAVVVIICCYINGLPPPADIRNSFSLLYHLWLSHLGSSIGHYHHHGRRGMPWGNVKCWIKSSWLCYDICDWLSHIILYSNAMLMYDLSYIPSRGCLGLDMVQTYGWQFLAKSLIQLVIWYPWAEFLNRWLIEFNIGWEFNSPCRLTFYTFKLLRVNTIKHNSTQKND